MTEIGDRARVRTDREAVAMTIEIDIVKTTEGTTKKEEFRQELQKFRQTVETDVQRKLKTV